MGVFYISSFIFCHFVRWGGGRGGIWFEILNCKKKFRERHSETIAAEIVGFEFDYVSHASNSEVGLLLSV